jgi:phage/plasmid primase-like uncharacterized protein
MTSTDSFRAAMRERGIAYDGFIAPDGKLHRFKAEGDSDASSWYVLHDDGKFMAGAFGCWRRSLNEKWNSANGDQLTADEKRLMSQRWREADNARKTDEEKRQTEAKIKASQLLSGAAACVSHPYLERKRVAAFGAIRSDDRGCLLLPLCDVQGVLHSLQFIAPDKRFHDGRDKDFLPGGKVQGCFYEVSDNPSGPIVICEGYATGASIHQATGWAVNCAMFCGNLLSVAKAMRKEHPHRTIILAADNDRFSKDNPGLAKAKEAAKEISQSFVAVPEFADEDTTSTDFNDLACVCGLSAVRRTMDQICPLSFLTFEAVGALVLPAEHNLLGDHVLAVGNLASFMAAGGVGKSSIMQQLAAACAARHEYFLKWRITPTLHDMRWLIIQAENSVYRVKRDAQCIKNWIGPEAWKRFNELVRILVPLNDADSFLDLDQPEVPIRLFQAIDLFQSQIIVFDALYNFSLRELSKGAEMLAAVSNCVRLAKRGNASRTPILLHHALPGSSGAVRATGFDRANYGRDSKVLHQLCRSVINITAASDDDNNQLLISCGKCSDGREFEPFVVKRDEETLIYSVDDAINVEEVVEKLRKPKSKAPLVSSDDVRQSTQVSGSTKLEIAKKLRENFGSSKESAYRYIRLAEKSGCIKLGVDQEKYFRQ